MKISYEPNFITSFNQIWDFISLDNHNRADKFKFEIKEKIEKLVFMPYKFKKSIYFNDENIRDFVFKGYTVVYKIYEKEDEIIIIGINKYKKDLD